MTTLQCKDIGDLTECERDWMNKQRRVTAAGQGGLVDSAAVAFSPEEPLRLGPVVELATAAGQ